MLINALQSQDMYLAGSFLMFLAMLTVIGVFIMIVLANALNLAGVHSYWQQVAVGVVLVIAAAADRLRHSSGV